MAGVTDHLLFMGSLQPKLYKRGGTTWTVFHYSLLSLSPLTYHPHSIQMPSPLNKVRTSKFTSVVETVLFLLENISEEKFWQSIFGERLTKLGQRYFGNDFIMLGMLFYVARKLPARFVILETPLTLFWATAILRTNWQKLLDLCMNRMSKRSKTISVRIYYHDAVFNAINFYVMKHTERLPGLTDAIAMYEESKSNSANQEEEKLVVGFYPRKFFFPFLSPLFSSLLTLPVITGTNTTNEILYNGRKLYVSSCAEDDENSTSSRPSYLNISMTTTPEDSIDSLKDILQEWCDDYNNTEDNKVIALSTWPCMDTYKSTSSFVLLDQHLALGWVWKLDIQRQHWTSRLWLCQPTPWCQGKSFGRYATIYPATKLV